VCLIMPNFAPIGQTVAEIWRFVFFQYGGRPPSCICFARVWTTHEEYLAVFIVAENLVGVDSIVSIICTF